ncbi:endonuclease domain-containing protein [Sphingobium sp.]|uniref:endonuclease domain-containing protein n=1 Tax=Sphingobium sp. TaxID=1912891 RepID=UPI0039C98107
MRGRPNGLKFRRQHPAGPYVLDFYSALARIAVEVDGAIHDDPKQIAHDARRDEWLATQGIAVLRVRASNVLRDFEAVTRLVLDRYAISPPPLLRNGPPLPLRAGRINCLISIKPRNRALFPALCPAPQAGVPPCPSPSSIRPCPSISKARARAMPLLSSTMGRSII